MLAVVQVPEHGLGVLATGGAQGAVGRHGHGVQVTVVTDMVGLQLAVLQRPDLEKWWEIRLANLTILTGVLLCANNSI